MRTFSSTKVLVTLCALLFCATHLTSSVDGANILGLFTSNSPSHLIVHMSVVSALAEKGHNVTVVCAMEPKVTHKSIKVIVIPPTDEQTKIVSEQLSIMASKKNNVVTTVMNMFGSLGVMITMQYDILQDKRFTVLYENPDTTFDLVIMGYFMNDFQLGVAAKFNCPIILDWMGPPMEMIDNMMGNPREVAYVPNMNVPVNVGEVMGFFKRVQNVFASGFFILIRFFLNWRMENLYIKLFPNDTEFPTYHQMKKNVSLAFCNSHFTEGPIRPNVPAVVEIGGIQIKEKPNPLPKDIEEFLNASAKNGAILFSLGSNLQGSNINPNTVRTIFKALSSLPQKVIWKWEDLNKTPGNSPNIMYKKWMPQDDILAHPNLKLFITHAGKGGVAEAQYHAVPMVALPVFADQNTNSDKIASSGYGIQLDLQTLTEDGLRNAVTEVISNPSYARNVQKFSELYRDRPLTAKENVVYWTEYVLRYYGAPHMQSPLVHLNSLQSLSLDVFFFLILIVYVIWRLAKLIIKFICGKLCKKFGRCDAKESNVKYSKVKKQ